MMPQPDPSTATAPVADARRSARIRAAVVLLARLGLAAVFISAAIPKILAPDLFAGNIFNYKILPPWGVNTMALVLPWLELFAGVLLALGIWSRASATIVAGLMIIFMIAYGSVRARGLEIACGCFEVGEHKATPAAWVLLRDSAFLAAALVVLRFGGGPSVFELLRRRRGRPAALP